MTLTKNDLIDLVHEKIGIPKAECASAVESTFEIIKGELESGTPVMISGFGKWSVKEKRPRKGRNPQTGDKITIDGRKVVTFKGAQRLKEEIS